MSKRAEESFEISREVARIRVGVLVFACALIGGAGLFTMTAWLVVKGGPRVGQHLGLLGQYFPGYSVTWGGSFLGFLYGAAVGGIAGWIVGTVYNGVTALRR